MVLREDRKNYYWKLIKYDILELLTWKPRSTIQKYFYRNNMKLSNDLDFAHYVFKNLKNGKK